MGGCQNYGHFLGPCYNPGSNTGLNLGDPKRDHNFDNHPYGATLHSDDPGLSATGRPTAEKWLNELRVFQASMLLKYLRGSSRSAGAGWFSCSFLAVTALSLKHSFNLGA